MIYVSAERHVSIVPVVQIKDQRYGEVVQILNMELQQHPKVSSKAVVLYC